jgi:hypothetical protein
MRLNGESGASRECGALPANVNHTARATYENISRLSTLTYPAGFTISPALLVQSENGDRRG